MNYRIGVEFLAAMTMMAAMGCASSSGDRSGSVKQPDTCDATLVCGQAITCVDGKEYPTTCGPTNCDKPIGACHAAAAACDRTLVCGQALTCVDGKEYPTTCGPANCDQPIGPCPAAACDPSLVCGQAFTCVDGKEYPTTCGPANCDKPLGPC
jgi:hypothetical protein